MTQTLTTINNITYINDNLIISELLHNKCFMDYVKCILINMRNSKRKYNAGFYHYNKCENCISILSNNDILNNKILNTFENILFSNDKNIILNKLYKIQNMINENIINENNHKKTMIISLPKQHYTLFYNNDNTIKSLIIQAKFHKFIKKFQFKWLIDRLKIKAYILKIQKIRNKILL
jgi:hypothetical protein